jgi:magnesium transporter
MEDSNHSLDILKPEFFNSFIKALENKNSKILLAKIRDFHPSEIASYIQTLNEFHRKKLLKLLEKDFDSRVLVELEPAFLEKIINEIDFKIIKKAVNELDSDEAASIIELLNYENKNRILSEISKKDRSFIEDNLSYKDNTAGRLMQKEVVKVLHSFNVGDAIDLLRRSKSLPSVFYDIFLVDQNEKFMGMVPLCSIVSNIRRKKISSIIKKQNPSVHFSIDQEDVADIFRKRNLTSIAVVDDENRLLGMINVDDVVDVIDDEAEEDILKLAGVVGDQNFYDAIISITKARFTWLFFNLIAAFIATYVIKNFENTIEKFAVLAAIMPIVASMGGCSGTQSLTTAVRAIAMKQLTWSNAFRSIGKELVIGLLNGIIFSVLSFFITYIWFDDYVLSIVISVSLLFNLVFGSFFGTFVPIILTRVGVDPAIASGTFVTTLTDIMGFFIFLSLASLYLI